MKINRFVALAAIVLLALGAMGFIGTRAFAQTQPLPAPQVQATEALEEQEPASGPDTDTLQDQTGNQAEAGAADAAAGQADAGPDEQSPLYTGSLPVEQAATDGMSETDEVAALASQATITVDDAKAAALAAKPGTTVVKAELDNENGALVYSVELSNGADVKVDAGNGATLHTDASGDNDG